MKAFETRVRLMALFVLICCLGFSTQSAKAQQTISFPDFNSTTGLQINGNAAVVGSVLRLTPATTSQVGSVWYANSLSLGQGFSTTFTFQFTGPGGLGHADGIAFVIQNGSFSNGTSGSLAIGPVATASGGGIGYQGLTKSVAVEFDTFQNGPSFPNGDISANEIAVQSCLTAANTANHQFCLIGSEVDPSGVGFSPAINLTDQNPHTAVITYTPPCGTCSNGTLSVIVDNQPVLSTNFNLANLGLDASQDAFIGFTAGTGDGFENQDILSWNFTATQSKTGSTISNTPATLAQQFVFNNTANEHVEFDFDYNPAFNANTLSTIAPNTVPRVSDDAVTPSDYQTMVKGTALAETQCFTSNGQLAAGNAACPKLTIQCTTDGTTFAGDTCPQSTVRNLVFKNVIDVIGGPALDTNHDPIIPPGSAPTLAMGSDNWSPTNGCTLEGPEAGQLCPKSIGVPFQDCCTSGGTTKGSNSAFIAGCCEREWTTIPAIPLWSNNTTVPVSFTSNPPSATNPITNTVINDYRPAYGQSVTYGFEAPGAALDPTFPVANDQTRMNPILDPPPAQCSILGNQVTWGTPATTFNTSGTVMVPGEGQYELHFFSTDCDDMEELVYAPNGANNWAKFKTTPFNVDTTPPTVNSVTLSAPKDVTNGVYSVNQSATATVVCSDPLSNHVMSGIAQCGSDVAPQTFTGNQASQTALNVPVPTSTAGQHTFHGLAKDAAGNTSQLFNVNYCVGYLVVPSSGNVVGFFQPPVDNPGPGNVVNVVKSGQAVPLKWGPVTNCAGAPATNLTAGPTIGGTGTINIILQNAAGICASSIIDNTITVAAAGGSGLQNLGGGSYQFNLKPVGPHGACLQVSVDTGDAVPHIAYLQIK
jgi:Legume lectin domain